jgi:hypothetical protein
VRSSQGIRIPGLFLPLSLQRRSNQLVSAARSGARLQYLRVQREEGKIGPTVHSVRLQLLEDRPVTKRLSRAQASKYASDPQRRYERAFVRHKHLSIITEYVLVYR